MRLLRKGLRGYGTVERGYVGVYDLHVEDAYRCRGVGTAICRAIFRYGIRQNAKYAYLIVHNKNQNAISLYSHMGFTTFYEYSFYCSPILCIKLWMHKCLGSFIRQPFASQC